MASRNERELQTLSTMLSLNDPLLSTVQLLYRNHHLFHIRVTSNMVSQISRFISISVNASQSKAMLLGTTTTLHFLFNCYSMELLLGSCLTSSIKGRITTEKGSVVHLLFPRKLPFCSYFQQSHPSSFSPL